MKLRHSESLNKKTWLVVAAITFLVWLPVVRNDFVDWDDLNMIVQNPRFNPPNWAAAAWYWTHPAWNLYQPLTTTAWAFLAWVGWVDAPDQFGGHMNPAVFHLASIILQTASAIIVFTIVRRACKNEAAAVIGALVFAIHPIQTEAVAFVGALNTPLSGFFGLLAVQQYLLAVDTTNPSPRAHRIAGLIALLLALLAKPAAVVIPVITLILDLAIHYRPLLKSARSILPELLLVLPCVIWTRVFQHGVDAVHNPIWYRPVIAADAICSYLLKITWPIPLDIDYGRTPQFVQSHGYGWITLIIPLCMIAVAVMTVRHAPLVSAAILIFLIAVLPNAGLVPFDSQLVSTVSDRYAYLSMLGVAVLIAFVVKYQRWLVFVFIPLLIALTVLTQRQIATWRNGETLFRHALSINPNSWMSDANLAVVIGDRSPIEAGSLCHKAITLRPDRPDAWNTLGSLLMHQGDCINGIDAFTHAHNLAPDNQIFAANLARAQAIR